MYDAARPSPACTRFDSTPKPLKETTFILENTRARVVRVTRVQIGPGFQIGLLEYSEDFSKWTERRWDNIYGSRQVT